MTVIPPPCSCDQTQSFAKCANDWGAHVILGTRRRAWLMLANCLLSMQLSQKAKRLQPRFHQRFQGNVNELLSGGWHFEG